MEESKMSKAVEFLNENPVQYLATVGRDGKAKCRPFMFAGEVDGKLWFCTNNTPDQEKVAAEGNKKTDPHTVQQTQHRQNIQCHCSVVLLIHASASGIQIDHFFTFFHRNQAVPLHTSSNLSLWLIVAYLQHLAQYHIV